MNYLKINNRKVFETINELIRQGNMQNKKKRCVENFDKCCEKIDKMFFKQRKALTKKTI